MKLEITNKITKLKQEIVKLPESDQVRIIKSLTDDIVIDISFLEAYDKAAKSRWWTIPETVRNINKTAWVKYWNDCYEYKETYDSKPVSPTNVRNS